MTTPTHPPAPESAGECLIADFSRAGADLGLHAVNDNVMGGRSAGGFELSRGELRFTGRTVTDGGGFSSIRSGPLPLDLRAFDGMRLVVCGDGRRYTWRLATDARYRGNEVAYRADFETLNGEWRTIDIPFRRFVPMFRGSRLAGPALDSGRISGMGVMICDGRDGPFALRIARVSAYATEAAADID